MKKTLTIISLFLVMMMAVTSVKAATAEEVIAYASKTHTVAGETIKLSNSEIVRAERYLKENPITEAEGDQLISKGEEAKAVMNEAGVSDPRKLKAEDKQKCMNIANEAAAVVGITLKVDSKSQAIELYKDGKKLDAITYGNNGKLAYTGNNAYLYIVPATVAIVAIAAVALRKRA